MKNILKTIGKIIWAGLGIFLTVLVISWSKYAFSGNGFGSIIVLILLPIFVILLIAYIIVTLSFKIFSRNKK